MSKNKKIEIRSGEVQEILGGVPSWIVRFGILVFLTVLILIISFTFIFKYPDIIKSDLIVTTENPPATIVARSTGKIVQLNVEDKQEVKADQLIALIENPANYEDIKILKSHIDAVQPCYDTLNYLPEVKFNRNLLLGEIQEFYSLFLAKNEELKQFNRNNIYQLKDKNFENQIRNLKLLYDRIYQQRQAVEKEYEITQRNYTRNQTLIARGAISSAEFEKAEKEMYSKRSDLDGLRSRLAEELYRRDEIEQRKIENLKEFEDLKIQYESALLQAFNNLKSEISNWELKYLMQSPINGIITFVKFYSENQNVTEGDRVFTIVPVDMGDLIGKVELPIRGSGKVEIGRDVNVKFDNFPYMEFGMVRGKVKNKSLVPEDNFYMVEIEFPNGLVTNYGNNLELQNQLKGQAEIITEDLKLIQRIFNPLKSLWSERVSQ